MRGTGGNRFLAADASIEHVVAAVRAGLAELEDWTRDTGRHLDLGHISVDTKRIPNGRISITVSADLQPNKESA